MKFSITPTIKKKKHFLYFGCKVGDQDNKLAPHVCCTMCLPKLAPHVCCTMCLPKLTAWVNGKGRCMPFGVTMV